jgi:phosphoribosylanthranilate isomerase
MSPIVKICGLSTLEALDTALDAGADMVGFVFFEPSPRHITLDTAALLGRRVKGRAKKVALTVNAGDDYLTEVVNVLSPDFLQLHGQESPERVSIIRARFNLPIIKALAIESRSDFEKVKSYADVGAWILFDAKAPAEATRPGGLGNPADWPLVNEITRRLEELRLTRLGRPFDWALVSGAIPGVLVILSGGLNAKNIEEALWITHVPAVDVSSGVESSPGKKDKEKIREFIRTAREAFVRLPPYEVMTNP